MANKRITDVDFVNSLNSGESFFINQNNSIKQINKSNIIFDITNGGTGASDVATARANLGITPTNIGAASENHTHTASEIGAASVSHSHTASEIGAASVSHSHTANDITTGTLPVARGGTGNTNGAAALNSFFAAGNTVLSSYQYGNALPAAGTKGRIFFKKVSS